MGVNQQKMKEPNCPHCGAVACPPPRGVLPNDDRVFYACQTTRSATFGTSRSLLCNEREEKQKIIDTIEKDWKEAKIEAETMRQHHRNSECEREKMRRLMNITIKLAEELEDASPEEKLDIKSQLEAIKKSLII